MVPVVVAVLAALVGAGLEIVLVDPGTAAGAVTLESATSIGADPWTRSVTIGEVADFPDTIAPVTDKVTAQLTSDPTTGGLTTSGDHPGLYGGSGNHHSRAPTPPRPLRRQRQRPRLRPRPPRRLPRPRHRQRQRLGHHPRHQPPTPRRLPRP